MHLQYVKWCYYKNTCKYKEIHRFFNFFKGQAFYVNKVTIMHFAFCALIIPKKICVHWYRVKEIESKGISAKNIYSIWGGEIGGLNYFSS